MNNIFTIMKKELFRYLSDRRMLLTTILLPGLMIYIVYSIMGQAMSSQFEVKDDYKTSVFMLDTPQSLKPVFDSLNLDYRDADKSMDEMKMQVENQDCDLIVVFPKNFEQAVAAYDSMTAQTPAPQVEIYYNSSKTESASGYSMITEVLNQYESSMINKFDINANADGGYDLASDKDITGKIFSMLFPMLLMTFIFSACTSLAPESISGEKERGTLTTLLVTPVRRSEIAIGKILALSILALLSGLSSFTGTALSLPKLMAMSGDDVGVNVNVYHVQDYALLLMIVLCSVLLIISLISVVSAYAKNVKEAGTYVSPLMIIIMIVSISTMFGNGTPQGNYWYLIPIYNSVQCMSSVFLFSVNAVHVMITFVSNLVYAGIFVWVLTRMFNSEKIMFSK
jgi:sodium transport system permease protein